MTCLRTTILLIALLAGAIPAIAQAQQGNFENPVDGSTESGISVISGWHCTASQITIDIDGVSLGRAGSGTGRPDTASVCGHTETGFSLLYNWNNLTPGQHVVRATADGVLLGTKTITTRQSALQKFARGLSKSTDVYGFPAANQVTAIEWREEKQSFVITGTDATAANFNSLDGTYAAKITYTTSGTSCLSSYGYGAGPIITEGTISIGLLQSGSSKGKTSSSLNSGTGICHYTFATPSGDAETGFNAYASGWCVPTYKTGTSVYAIAKNMKQSPDGMGIEGTIETYFSGCTKTEVLSSVN